MKETIPFHIVILSSHSRVFHNIMDHVFTISVSQSKYVLWQTYSQVEINLKWCDCAEAEQNQKLLCAFQALLKSSSFVLETNEHSKSLFLALLARTFAGWGISPEVLQVPRRSGLCPCSMQGKSPNL